MKKTTSIRIKLDESEKSLIEQYSANMELNISQYVRNCCIIKPPTKAKIKKGS